MPPLAVRVWEYDVPADPPGSTPFVVIVSVVSMVSVYALDVAACAASMTPIVKFAEPALTGVPLIVPLDAFSPSPAGSVPETREKVYGDVPLET